VQINTNQQLLAHLSSPRNIPEQASINIDMKSASPKKNATELQNALN
jgi:hypothetical protein